MNACIVRICSDNKVLLVKNRERQWEFPGGKIDEITDRVDDANGNSPTRDIIDLLKAAKREFHEEISNDIECIGNPSKILFNLKHKTVFFVYQNQEIIIDCVDRVDQLSSTDAAIEDVKQFDCAKISISNTDDPIPFSFECDKQIIQTLLK